MVLPLPVGPAIAVPPPFPVSGGIDYHEDMTREQIDAIFERAREWPLDRQEEAAEMLLILEDRAKGIYHLSDEEGADIDEALAEVERGRGGVGRGGRSPVRSSAATVKVRYSAAASAQIEEAFDYIARDNPRAAQAFLDRLEAIGNPSGAVSTHGTRSGQGQSP